VVTVVSLMAPSNVYLQMERKRASFLTAPSSALKEMESKLLSLLMAKKRFCFPMEPGSENTLTEKLKRLTLMDKLRSLINEY
jgi:hypothetical protein